jgi:hypothetical protein
MARARVKRRQEEARSDEASSEVTGQEVTRDAREQEETTKKRR